MRSNYKKLGPYIEQVNNRNKDLTVDLLLGVSIRKILMPSIANTVGTNMNTYRIIENGQFAYGPVTSRNGDKVSIALMEDYDEAIVSQAYTVFKIRDPSELLPEYLMMWFRRPEFDRYARFKSHGSARETFDWDELCEVKLPIPSPERQKEIVYEFNTVVNRIKLKEELINKLEETAQNIFKYYFFNEEGKNGETVRLGNFIDVKGGLSYNGKDIGKGSSLLLGMGCVSFKERFLESGIRFYSDVSPDTHLINSGELVIATRQQSENMPILGYPAMIPESLKHNRVIVSNNLYRVINKSSLSNEILFQLLRSKGYRDHILLNTKGTTVGMITKDAVEDFKFHLPHENRLRQLQKKLEPLVKYINENNIQINKLKQLESILLSKASIEELQLI